ncbi:MAG: hypothetical protein K0Q68_1264 [Moraxellaceae bacterium]|nr:hypothetical protein [Moraxellaceae bacterium]
MTAAVVETPQARAARVVESLRNEIPLTAAMRLGLHSFDGETLVLQVPLAPNINDKGTAFAGSITALGCITGWCLLTLWSEQEIGPCQVAIFDSRFVFRKPLCGDFTATVTLPETAARDTLQASLRRKGKGRMALRIVLADSEGEAASLEAEYAIWRS